MMDNGKGASSHDEQALVQAPSRAVSALTGFDPSRDLAGVDQVAAYFEADPAEVASHMAWFAGYEAGARKGAGYDAGYADAERHIMDYLMSPEADGCNIIEAISERRHAQASEGGEA